MRPRRSFCLLLLVLSMPAGFARGQQSEADFEPWRGEIVVAITIAGNNVTRDWVIAREIWSEKKRPLDPKVVHDDIVRLENLAIFGSVTVEVTERDGGVALDFEFTEMPWIIPFPSIAYSEQNGFSVGLGVASPNFTGRRITLSANVRVGGETSYNFKGENPWISGNHLSAGVDLFHRISQNKLWDFKQTSDQAQFIGGSYLGENGRLKVRAGYYGVGSDKPGVTLSERNYDNLWHVGASLGYDSRDSWRVPRNGWQNELALLYYGGDADMLAVDFDIRRYFSPAHKHIIATGPLVSYQSGMVDQQIPIYMQYNLGGANSVRGFKLDELGPLLYGKNQLLYTLEYRYVILPPGPVKVFKWSFGIGMELALFGDVGVVWSNEQELNWDRTVSGYGAGIRLLVPGIESVRFDMGISEYGDVVFNFGTRSIFDARKARTR